MGNGIMEPPSYTQESFLTFHWTCGQLLGESGNGSSTE